jgi:uncharacterized membrane protein YjgN (DUF898 family)
MQVPSIEPRLTEARPWGLAPGELPGIRLQPREAPLLGIVIKGTLLMLVTLGIYRFWYKTNLRRYYWNNTRLLDDGFEYTGTGRELFVGFLIAIAILAPIYIGVAIATLMLGEVMANVVSGVVGFVLIPCLVQIAVYRARRYRLSRTRYRGIRFGQTGTGRAYLMYSISWLLLAAVTLGICVPQMRTALYRYRTNNTFFGTVQASFVGDSKPLMKRWLLVWGAIVVSIVLFGFFAAGAAAKVSDSILVLEIVLALLVLAAVPFLWIIYRVAEFRHFTSNTLFGGMKLSSDLSAKPVIWTMVLFALALVGIFLVIGLLAALIGGVMAAALGGSAAAIIGILFGLTLPIGIFLIYAVLVELFLRRRLWRLYAGSVAIANTAELRNILQQAGQNESGFGEAFDGGFEIAG